MRLQSRSGLRASAVKVALDDALVHITTANGATFAWPVDDVVLADFSAGKILYLSDIEPASQSSTPLVGLARRSRLLPKSTDGPAAIAPLSAAR